MTADLVSASSLILTASVAERSAVAKIDPSARSRTFTLKEAVALAGVDVDVVVETDDESPLARFSSTIHARRGLTLTRPRPRGLRLPWSARVDPVDPLDIIDGHVLGGRRHELALDDVTATAERLLDAFRRVTV